MILFFLLTFISLPKVYAQYDYAKDKKVFIQSTTLSNCMLLAADKYPEAKQKPPTNTFLKSFKGRVCGLTDNNEEVWMQYLALSANRNCDFATGQEETLKEWVLKQSDNSIDPLTIFEKSLELNTGNLMNSLITVHQLLRYNARWFSTVYDDYKSSTEESRAFWNKFIDIRGDLSERGPSFEGDHAGSWYRIWGMALWRTRKGFVPMVRMDKCSSISSSPISERLLRNIQAYSMAISAEAVKPLFVLLDLSYKPQLKDLRGKAEMNTLGVDIGATFASYLADGALNLDPSHRKRVFEKICQEKKFYSYGK